MFSTFKQRLLLGVYVFIVLSIPIASYLVSEQQTVKSQASETNKAFTKPTPKPSPKLKESPAKELLSMSEQAVNTPGESEPTPGVSSPTIANSFGPTLSLKANLEGRPVNNQTTKLFIGIMEGSLIANPKFLLSFSVNLASDGSYSNLSLAGLSVGSKYTALLKGSSQIATSSAFIMSPTVTNLNEGEPLNMLSGDLNEDNTINSSDYAIVQKALGTKNDMADFNKDGLVNTFDLGFVTRNLGKTGASGSWTSPLPKTATPSGSLATGGYWIWIPPNP